MMIRKNAIRSYREVLNFFTIVNSIKGLDLPILSNESKVETVNHIKPINWFNDFQANKINILI